MTGADRVQLLLGPLPLVTIGASGTDDQNDPIHDAGKQRRVVRRQDRRRAKSTMPPFSSNWVAARNLKCRHLSVMSKAGYKVQPNPVTGQTETARSALAGVGVDYLGGAPGEVDEHSLAGKPRAADDHGDGITVVPLFGLFRMKVPPTLNPWKRRMSLRTESNSRPVLANSVGGT